MIKYNMLILYFQNEILIELDLLRRDPNAIFAIRRVQWKLKGNYDALDKDSHNNVSYFFFILYISRVPSNMPSLGTLV